jgi:hypothetical protein
MAMLSFKGKYFAVREQQRICIHPVGAGRCEQRFSTTTSVTVLKNHFKSVHKATAHQLGLLAQGDDSAAAAAAPAASSASASQTDSVVDMLDAEPAAAIPHKPRARIASGSSSVSSPPPAKVARTSQLSLQSAFLVAGNDNFAREAALFFATNHIAYHVADSASWATLVAAIRSSSCAAPKRKGVKAAVRQLANSIKQDVLQRLQSSSAPVTVAIDGWTNVRQTKVTNVVLLCCGAAYYWCSIANTYDANTATWLEQQLSPVLNELVASGVRFSALVADNEAVNDALWTQLTASFPFLIRVPCAAHTIQLVVHQIMLIRRFERCITTVRSIIRRFEKNKADRLQLRQLQSVGGEREYTLVKPCDTRWNSMLYCCERLLKLRRFVDIIFQQDGGFWAETELLCAFLQPFQVATDVLQRDSATLFDVWEQKRALEQHIVGMKARVGATVVRHALVALKQRWEKQVNKEATHAVALFSLIADTSSITPQQFDAARQFILDFGVRYLRYYSLSALSEDDLRAQLLHQLGCFTGRRSIFASLDSHIATARRSSISSCTALDIWELFSCELSIVAKALLCITASEAAVERSFSQQDAVHTKRRNRLLDQAVQNELFVKFNSRALDRPADSHLLLPSFRCINLSPDADLDAASVDSGAETDTESLAEPVSHAAAAAAAAEPPSAASASSAAAAAPARSQSMLEGDMRAVLEEYIAEHHITLVAFAARSRYWNNDRRNALQSVLPRGGYVVDDAIASIRSILHEQHE